MTLSLSWYITGFSSAAITFTGNWWWALLFVLAMVLDFAADVFRKTKIGQALIRRWSK